MARRLSIGPDGDKIVEEKRFETALVGRTKECIAFDQRVVRSERKDLAGW